MVTYRDKHRTNNYPNKFAYSTMPYPTVSVVMPVRNEARFIERSLTAVLNQDYPTDKLEIIIADGMSTDDTIERIQKVRATPPVCIVQNTGFIQSAGLNRAIERATGEIIVRVDGHTIVTSDYVRRCVEVLYATQAQAVGGRLYPTGQTAMGQAIACASSTAFAVPSAFRVARQSGYTDTVYLGAWRRATLIQLGLFSEQLTANEDYELNYRLRTQGGKIYLSQTICSTYYGPETLTELAQQNFRYGYWKSVMLRQHPKSVRIRQLAAPAFWVYLLISLGLFFIQPSQYACLLIGVYIYGLLIALFSVTHSWKRRSLLWRLLPIYPVIHLAWGAGFWWGLIRQQRIFSRSLS